MSNSNEATSDQANASSSAGGAGPYDVTVSLYDDCPGYGGTLIPGTTFTWEGVPDDGYAYVLQVDPVTPAVTIPDTVWMVATFSTPEAAWIIAENAELGYTDNVFGGDVPPWACNYYFGGSPYAGMWANLRCVEGEAKARSNGAGCVLHMETVEVPVVIEPVEVFREH